MREDSGLVGHPSTGCGGITQKKLASSGATNLVKIGKGSRDYMRLNWRTGRDGGRGRE